MAVIVLTLVFHSAAAMLLTLFASLLSLAGGMMLLTIGSAFADFPSFAPTLGVMLGLGAGIDYALLIVGRYREQLATGDSVDHAARVANQTAGTSIIAAGTIVVVAITGLLATGLPFVGRMGLGSAIMVATVAVGAVTILPVLMGAFARRLRPRKPEHVAPSPAFARWGRMLTRRPWLAAGAGALILVVLASPFASLRLGQPDDGNDRDGSTTRVAYDRLAEGFGPGFNGPLVLAASLPSGQDNDRDAQAHRARRVAHAGRGRGRARPAQRAGRRRRPSRSSPRARPRTSAPRSWSSACATTSCRRSRPARAPRSTSGVPRRSSRTWPTRSPAACRSSSRSWSGCR